jgi:hypothetical protein
MADPIPFPGFVGSAFGAKSPNIDSQDLNNLYLEHSESQAAKVPSSLLPCPGFRVFTTLPTSPVRGLYSQNDRTFAVGGDVLYEITRGGLAFVRAMTVLATPSAPSVTPSPLDPALNSVDQPVVTHGGALGTTTYGYKVTATNVHGETIASVEGTSSLGNATLSATNYTLISWAAVAGAHGYKVYRTTGPGSGVLVGSVPAEALFFQDIGTAGTPATPPVSNTTGGVAGTTTYGYKIVARLGLGHTAPSGEGTTNAGQATLDEDNFLTISWPAIPNAHSYEVYRTTGGTTGIVLLTSTSETTCDDVGADGETATVPSGNTTGTASILNDGTTVSWASSGDAGHQLLIGSGGGAYLLDLETNVLAQVVNGCTAVGYLGNYFWVLDAATSTVRPSELLDGFAWDDSQVYQRSSAGDRWLSMGVTSNELWLFGSNTSDIYALTGDNDTRIAPFQNITVPQGIIAPASLAVDGDVLTWLGQSDKGAGIVWRASDYNPQQISTRGLEKEVKAFSTLADATSFSYQEDGHTFYVLTFPSDDRTWVYDKLTNEWHRRGFWDPNDMDFTAYRAWCHTFAFGGIAFGTHLVGDRDSGVIAEMSTAYQYDIDGATVIRRVRQCPHITDKLTRTTVWALLIDLEVGNGAATGQGSDPTVMLEVSKDGGKTWGLPLWASAGAQGEYSTRVKFTRLGDGRDWVFRITLTDPIAWRIAGAYFEPQGGTS